MKRFFSSIFSNPVEAKVMSLIDRASDLGMRAEDRTNALEMLEYNEWGSAFDIVVAQMYEYDIKIDKGFLALAYETGDAMRIDRGAYTFLEELLPAD
jgi:hypothetical protein